MATTVDTLKGNQHGVGISRIPAATSGSCLRYGVTIIRGAAVPIHGQVWPRQVQSQ